MTPLRIARQVALLGSLALLLAACGGRLPRETGESRTTPSSTVKKPPLKKGGGYYKDDGPADEIPDTLDAIPDAQPKAELLHRFANRPYVVFGRAYVPQTRVASFKQRGIASWYGKKFHGQKTSTGESYDMFAMSAAHPTLALPSYVRVTHLGNGRSVVVRVMDRGPFHADRIIDLSYAAAYRLGYVNDGSAQVEIETILPDALETPSYARPMPPLPDAPTPADEVEAFIAARATDENHEAPDESRGRRPDALQKGVFVQLGAFSNAENAASLRAHLARELDWASEKIQLETRAGMHRVQLGPYAHRGDAEKAAERIRAEFGYSPSFVTR